MNLTKKQYKELEDASDRQLREKLKNSSRFLDDGVWNYGSAVDITKSKFGGRGLLIFIPYESKRDFDL